MKIKELSVSDAKKLGIFEESASEIPINSMSEIHLNDFDICFVEGQMFIEVKDYHAGRLYISEKALKMFLKEIEIVKEPKRAKSKSKQGGKGR